MLRYPTFKIDYQAMLTSCITIRLPRIPLSEIKPGSITPEPQSPPNTNSNTVYKHGTSQNKKKTLTNVFGRFFVPFTQMSSTPKTA